MNKSPQGNDKFICSSVDCPPAVRDEFFRLVNLHLDDTLSDIDSARLQTLMREHTVLVNTYVDLVVIHGQLTWGAAACTRRKVVTANDELSDHDVRSFRSIRDGLRRSTIRYATAVVLVLLPAVVGSLYFQQKQNSDGSKYPENHGTVVKSDGGESLRSRQTSSNKFTGDGPTSIPGGEHRFADPAVRDDHGMVAGAQSDALPPLKLNVLRGRNSVDIPEQTEVVSARAQNPPSRDSQFTRTDGQIVAHLNDLLEQSWADHGVSPSPPADDYEWIRRAYVTIAGRIPTSAEVRVFFDRSESRTTVIERLVNSNEAASWLAVRWTNLLIGRTDHRGVDRESLYRFLHEQFLTAAPWTDTVTELITATGRSDTNGATNFLLAHLNNEATPATAVTARLFLGVQLSCVQCHDHPFVKGMKQRDYWGLNAFFKDTDRITGGMALSDEGPGRLNGAAWTLTNVRRPERMTFYEDRAGRQSAVLPTFAGEVISEDSGVNRREALAELLIHDPDRHVARAFVNRTWEWFFGSAFTAVADDMGPHAPVSHPEVLDFLSDAFVQSDYDVLRLMTWIASCDAWQRTSRVLSSNAADCPENGELPLFSRTYVTRMSPEQVYESVRVAIRSVGRQHVDEADVDSLHRREWVRQFAHAYDTDENDEAVDFDGTITQALVMMNGEEVDTAIHQAADALVAAAPRSTPAELLKEVGLAVLSRLPTESEDRIFRTRYRELSQQMPPRQALPVVVEDMLWAYLNSSEFVLVH